MDEKNDSAVVTTTSQKMTFQVPKRYFYVGAILLIWILGIIVLFVRRNALATLGAAQEASSFDVGVVVDFKDVFEEFAKGPYVSILRKGSISSGQYEHKLIWAGSRVGGGYGGALEKLGNSKNEFGAMTVNKDKMFFAVFAPDFVNKEMMKADLKLDLEKDDNTKHTSVEVLLKKGYGIAGLRIDQGTVVSLQAIQYNDVVKVAPKDLVMLSSSLKLDKVVNYEVPFQ